jgi:hypothetical protein
LSQPISAALRGRAGPIIGQWRHRLPAIPCTPSSRAVGGFPSYHLHSNLAVRPSRPCTVTELISSGHLADSLSASAAVLIVRRFQFFGATSSSPSQLLAALLACCPQSDGTCRPELAFGRASQSRQDGRRYRIAVFPFRCCARRPSLPESPRDCCVVAVVVVAFGSRTPPRNPLLAV